ncbi:MAG: imidazole glycerol phosphate synthase subunit HisH [Actinomycetota bacterium]|nr:imidazole glycerol phosphate synthase subunit HisH [Actinomycetota bacterium]
MTEDRAPIASVGVVDHGMGNLRSVARALEAAGATVTLSAEPIELEGKDALCVPGQGIFGRAMSNLVDGGLAPMLHAWIASDRPLLGICLGLQLLFDESDERGPVAGLGVIPGRVAALQPAPGLSVPHIGWNAVEERGAERYFYFDHSYVVVPTDASVVAGWCEHGRRFGAAVRTGSILGVQFHPEKSGAAGIDLLKGWLHGSPRLF